MLFSREQVRAVALSGTISVPVHFPELGELFFLPHAIDAGCLASGKTGDVLRVIQRSTIKITITRNFLLDDVAAVFLPADRHNVRLDDGCWLLGSEIASHFGKQTLSAGGSNLGIAYVRESAHCLMQVEAALTAAESAEYYPPISGDRSVDHYRLDPQRRVGLTTCEPCTKR